MSIQFRWRETPRWSEGAIASTDSDMFYVLEWRAAEATGMQDEDIEWSDWQDIPVKRLVGENA